MKKKMMMMIVMMIWTHTSSQHFLLLHIWKLFSITVVFDSRLMALGIFTGQMTIVKLLNTVRGKKITNKPSQSEEEMAKDKGMLSL